MEELRTKRLRLRAVGMLAPAALIGLVTATLLAPSRGAAAGPASPPEAAMPPPDGKYANVVVEGRTVPMIHVMEGGTVVLVDTDGKKPRSWKEQFKRKGNLPLGTYDVHKTDVNGNGTFADDPIDRQAVWTIDNKGNITAH